MDLFDIELLHKYTCPKWAKNLPNVPKHKLQLAMLPTPIHRWNLPGLPEEFEIFIKRDDMTGSLLSGNKVRKKFVGLIYMAWFLWRYI